MYFSMKFLAFSAGRESQVKKEHTHERLSSMLAEPVYQNKQNLIIRKQPRCITDLT